MSTNLKLCGDVWRMTSFCRWRHMSWVTQIEKNIVCYSSSPSFSSFSGLLLMLLFIFLCRYSRFQCYFLPSLIPQQKKQNPFDMSFPPLKIHTQQHPPVEKLVGTAPFVFDPSLHLRIVPSTLVKRERKYTQIIGGYTQQAILPTIYIYIRV